MLLQQNYRELMVRAHDHLLQARAHSWLGWLLCYAILLVGAIHVTWQDYWHLRKFKRLVRRILKVHDREMHKMGYRGP